MQNQRIYSNIIEMVSPIGVFIITCNKRTKIPFHVERVIDYTYPLFDNEGIQYGALENKDIYNILIPVNTLILGEEYEITFTGNPLENTISGERTYGKMGVIDNYVIGISAYDPNDDEKSNQDYQYSRDKGFLDRNIIVPKEKYNKTYFIQYELKDDCINGFRFELLDYSREYIYFTVAWLKNDNPSAEDAIEYWIT